MARTEVGAATAIEMRGDFGESPAELFSSLQEFFNKMFQLEIADLEKDLVDLSPFTIVLFRAIERKMESAHTILVEKLTADDNVDQFTQNTESGIARNMPPEMVPLVIAALSKITSISSNAHKSYESMTNQLPIMLVQLKNMLVRQRATIYDEEVRELETSLVVMKDARLEISAAAASLGHDKTQQHEVEKQTSWFETAIQDLRIKIEEKKQALQMFFKENEFFEVGAKQLQQPI